MPRIRFDLLLERVIRDEQAKPREPAASIETCAQEQTDGDTLSHAQQLPWRRKLRRQVVDSARFLLTPIKPFARYARRYLVERVETDLVTFAASLSSIQKKLNDVQIEQSRLIDVVQMQQAQLQAMQEVVQLLHPKLDDLGLRSRGALPVDDATFALRTYDGFVLVPRQDNQLLLMLLDAGPQGLKPGTRRVLLKILAPAMTFVDVGAHIGLLTMTAARAVGPSGWVVAIEPVPLSFDLLRRGLTVNALLDRVTLKCAAVGAHHERCRFFVRSVLGHSSLVQSDTLSATDTEIDVEVAPLDDLIPRRDRVDLVKIDVEGSELAVLAGMTRIATDNRELAIIADFGPSHLRASHITPENWFSAFRKYGFDAFVIDEGSGNCYPASLAELADVVSVNVLFIRRASSAFSRVFN